MLLNNIDKLIQEMTVHDAYDHLKHVGSEIGQKISDKYHSIRNSLDNPDITGITHSQNQGNLDTIKNINARNTDSHHINYIRGSNTADPDTGKILNQIKSRHTNLIGRNSQSSGFGLAKSSYSTTYDAKDSLAGYGSRDPVSSKMI